MIRLGYACISIPLRDKDIFCSRTLTLKSLESKGVEEAKRLAILNIRDLVKIIEYNESIGVRFFRITSNLFPHMGNPRSADYSMDFAREELRIAGELARKYGHRITMHPGQFTQLGSPTAAVVEQSIRDLNIAAKTFEYMGMTPELGSVMIIHGGGGYGDKDAALSRWGAVYRSLPESTRKYIAVENDEFTYNVMDLLPLCEREGVPLCIDFFHHQVGHKELFDIYDPKLIQRVMNTWKLRGIKPKIHWSNQAPNLRKGAHGDCVTDIPREIIDVCVKYNSDCVLECKLKDECLLKIYPMYFDRVDNNGRIEWYLKRL